MAITNPTPRGVGRFRTDGAVWRWDFVFAGLGFGLLQWFAVLFAVGVAFGVGLTVGVLTGSNVMGRAGWGKILDWGVGKWRDRQKKLS